MREEVGLSLVFLLEDHAGEIKAQNWKPVIEAAQKHGKSVLVILKKDKPLIAVRDADRSIFKARLGAKIDMLDRGLSLYGVKPR